MRDRRALWFAAVTVVAAACSFPGSGPNVDPVDGGVGPADAPRADATPGAPDARQPPDAMPPPPPDAMPPMATCAGYAPIGGGFPAGATYRGVGTRRTWSSARADCRDDDNDADLVVIDNAAEAMALTAIVEDPGTPIGPSPYFWSGVYDPNGGADNDWTTVRGGAATYLPWASQQPTGGSQNCMLVDDGSPYEFYDFDCNAGQVYVCECLP